MARLGDYVNIKTGKLDANASSEDGQYPFFTCSVEPLRIDTYSYDCECVLVAGNGDLNVKYYNGKFDAYQRTYIIESKDKNVLSVPYLYCFLDRYVEELRKQAIGGVIKYIKLGNLTEAQIPMRSMNEQNEVVVNINKANELISLRKQQLSKLDELVKSRFIELFDVQKCQKKTLGECTDFVDYRGHTPELSDAGTIRMVNAKSVGKGFFKYVDEYVTEETYDSWMHRGFGHPGDILFVTEGHTFGNTCLIPNDLKKFALGQRVITIKGHQEVLNAFLCSYMQTDMFWKDINVYRTGGTAQGIRSKDLVKVYVPIPPLEQQKQFAAFVEQIDKSKLEIQKSLEKLETLKKALMQKYFG